jgi:uncharacterized membrane protein YgcG
MTILKYMIPFIVALFSISAINAQDLPNKPNPPRLVVDYAGILSTAQINALEN